MRGQWMKDIKAKNEANQRVIKAFCDEIQNLRIYLLSDKFAVDTTVQAQDVLRRLDEIQQNALQTEYYLVPTAQEVVKSAKLYEGVN